MFISMNWINEFVDLSGIDIDSLIRHFTLSTAEVEDIYHMGENTEKVVVGKILTVEKHPDSKKLHLLTVDGGDRIYNVVCGAPNVEVGIKVPFVKAGGMVQGNKITTAKIAGYESEGMCCSEKELGISADHSGIMVITDDIPVGTDFLDAYDVKDTVFEIDNKSLTNRPDLWGHYGIAREFAALTGRPLKPIEKSDLTPYDNLNPIDIQVLDKDLCFRYTGLKVRNIKVKTSPVNMRIRLFYCGLRAINLLADLTNYIMLELGQPMHAFDCSKVGEIRVKRFDKPFVFDTLDGVHRNIDEKMLMICNDRGPVAIAGIMGGLDSEITDNTDSLLLESANFDAPSVRKSSSRLGLRTDASMRYEKTLDPEITTVAIERFIKILKDIDPTVEIFSRLTDVYVKRYPQVEIKFDKAYVDRYTGIKIDNDRIINTLNSLGFTATEKNDVFDVIVPTWRATKDVTIKADIIEEITRIYGYDNFTIETTKSALHPVLRSAVNYADRYTKDLLVMQYGLHEVNSYIWCDNKKYKEIGIEVEKNVKIINSVNPDHIVIRNSMVPTLLVFLNENRTYSDNFGIFEIGRVVNGLDSNGLCIEHKKLGIALFSRTHTEKELVFNLRDIVLSLFNGIKRQNCSFSSIDAEHSWQHPTNVNEIKVDDVRYGEISTLHPSVCGKIDKKANIAVAEIDMDLFALLNSKTIKYSEPSKFPGIDIDLSLVVSSSVKYSEISSSWNNVTDLLKKVTMIDMYDGEIKGVTLRFSFVSEEKTLSMNEVQKYMDVIIEKLSEKGICLRK